jgi:hypothetical protein
MARAATEGMANAVFGDGEKKREESGETCRTDPVGDLYAGIDSVFQGISSIVKGGK